MAELSFYLFGAPRIEYQGQPVEVDTRKAVALLAFLAITGEAHRRDELATLLWPEYDQHRSRANLRRTLSVLNKTINGFGLLIERETLALDLRADIWVDVRHFHQLLNHCETHHHVSLDTCPKCLPLYEEAISLYGNHFMAGFSLRDSPGFDDWQYLQGESLEREYALALKGIISCCRLNEEYDQAIAYGQQWLELDSLHEPAHRELMILYALNGQRASALRQYRHCVRILEEELGVSPLEETTTLYERILSGELAETKSGQHSASQIAPSPLPVPLPTKSPLIGRSNELDDLLASYQSLEADGRMAILAGEAGIGKTRLAETFLATAEAQGGLIIRTRCYEGESQLAYSPFVEALRDAYARIEDQAWWLGLPDHWLHEGARLLPELEQLKPNPIVDIDQSDSPGAQSRFFEGISQVFFALFGRSTAKIEGSGQSAPGVFFIDDLHWADAASIDLLSYLIRRLQGQPIFILVTWREAPIGSELRMDHLFARGRRDISITQITLERLNESDVRELVEKTDPSIEFGGLVDRLFQETEGLPYFLIEYLAALGTGLPEVKVVQNGADNIEETIHADAPWPIPGNIRDLLHSRLALADETGHQLLQTASVIGRSFDFDILRETSGRGEEETVIGLETLIRQGFIIEQKEEAHFYSVPTYDFSHEKLRGLVYEEISLARRRLLHKRVAMALSNGGATDTARPAKRSNAAQIAYHYRLGGMEKEAALYFKQAGDDARSVYANGEALAHYLDGLALGYPDPATLYEDTGDLYTLQGQYDKALSVYETAAAMIDPLEKESSLAWVEHKIGRVYHRNGEWELAAGHFEAALSKIDDDGRRSRLLSDWSLTAHRAGDYGKAQELAKEALTLADAADDIPATAQAHNILGILAGSEGDTAGAIKHLEQSLAMAQSLTTPGLRIAALNNLSRAYASGGEIEQALELGEEALILCREQGDRHHEAALNNNMADLYHMAGRAEESMAYLKEGVAIYAEIGGEVDQWRPEIWKLTEW